MAFTGIQLPSDPKQKVKTALEIIEACRTSQAGRASFCRQINALVETGRQDGTRSLLNKLYRHIDRAASHLFSPTELKFAIDFENEYPPDVLKRGAVIAKILGRDWARTNTDTLFAQGVFESLKYGACLLKQWPEEDANDEGKVTYQKDLVMPWQFGVYREDICELDRQPAMTESMVLSIPEVWKRIWHMPDADKLMQRVRTHAQRGNTEMETSAFMHQVLSTSTLNTGNTGTARQTPGGIVQLNNDPNYAILGPELGVDLVRMHELWLWGDGDYQTVQIIEPDILVTRYKAGNLLIHGKNNTGVHPYTLVQPNQQKGYIWGRSEINDLIEVQGWLATTSDDTKRLLGIQIDKILGFSGFDGIQVETYDQMRAAGFFTGNQGATITDLTPKFPAELLPILQFIIGQFDSLGGFENLMQGKGDSGVRAGTHANTLLKTGSPTLRDRSLIVERQCAQAAELRLRLMEAKEGRNYWTDGSSLDKIDATSFLLTDLPDDWQVAVDGHSGSPIFADDHQQLIAFGLKSGICDAHYAADHLPYPDKDRLHQAITAREKQQAEMLAKLQQTDPEGFAKVLEHRGGGRR